MACVGALPNDYCAKKVDFPCVLLFPTNSLQQESQKTSMLGKYCFRILHLVLQKQSNKLRKINVPYALRIQSGFRTITFDSIM